MKKVFVKTNNVKRFVTMMNNLQNRAEGVPGMGLVYGDPGLGKTQAINWWVLKNDALLIRCTQLMTPKWLLCEILDEMGEIQSTRTSECFNQVIRNLIMNPRVLIIDEIEDRLHPMLVEYIIKRFQYKNTTKAQLIFTTHSIDIMNREMFRRDQYYLVDKNGETGVSELYSVSDFSVRNDEKVGKAYLLGKYGAVPYIREE